MSNFSNGELFIARIKGISNLSQAKIASKLCWKESKISKIKKGEHDIKASDLLQAHEVFNCTTDYLLGLTNTNNIDNKSMDYPRLLMIIYSLWQNGTIELKSSDSIVINDPILKYMLSSLITIATNQTLSDEQKESWINDFSSRFNYPLLLSKILVTKDRKSKEINLYKDFLESITHDQHVIGMKEHESYIKEAESYCSGEIRNFIETGEIKEFIDEL